MSFFGKEYVYESNEGLETFLALAGRAKPDPSGAPAKVKFEKNGDTYTSTVIQASGTKVTSFKDGVEFDDVVDGNPAKVTGTVKGNVVTVVQKFEKGTFVRTSVFDDDKLVVTLSIQGTDKKATITFKAA